MRAVNPGVPASNSVTFKVEAASAALPDLAVSNVNAVGDPWVAGQTVTVDYTIQNIGSSSAVPSTTQIWISKDGVIDGNAGDRRVGTDAVGSLAAGGATTSRRASFTLPPRGDAFWTGDHSYTLGVYADTQGQVAEESEANNGGVDQVAISGTVSGGGGGGVGSVDLYGLSFNASPNSQDAGRSLDVDFIINNPLSGSSGAFAVAFYLSTNSTITTSDTLIGTYSVPNVPAFTPVQFSTQLILPPGGSSAYGNGDGDYFVGMIVDANNNVAEQDESNNHNRGDGKDRQEIRINRTSQGSSGDIDLLGNSFNSSPGQLQPGQRVNLSFEVRNRGDDAAGPFNADFYISRDGTINDSDEYLGRYRFDSLGGNRTSNSVTRSFTLPPVGDPFWSGQGDGQYTLGMIVDGGDDVAETNESNNRNTGGNDQDSVTIVNTAGNQGDRYEPNDSASSSANLGVVEGKVPFNSLNMHYDGDRDYYRFTLNGTGRVEVRAEFPANSAGTAYINAYDSNGNSLSGTSGSSSNHLATASFNGVKGQTYIVGIFGTNKADSYDLEVDAPFADLPLDRFEPNDNQPTQLGELRDDLVLSGLTLHNRSDNDSFWFTIPFDGAGVVEITPQEPDRRVWGATLYDVNRPRFVDAEEIGNVTRFTLGPQAQGSYSLQVSGDPATYTLRITPPRPPSLPTLTIDDAQVAEGDDGTKVMQFFLTLDGETTGGSSVAYATADGTAKAGEDYTAVSGTLAFSAGQTSATIKVPILGDDIAESDETFTLNLSAPVNTTLANAKGEGRILNDDQPPAPRITYDVDGSGTIGSGDYSFLSAAWHSRPGDANWDARVDFDGSGYIGSGDYSWFSASWHKRADDPTISYPPAANAAAAQVSASAFAASAARILPQRTPLTLAASRPTALRSVFTVSDLLDSTSQDAGVGKRRATLLKGTRRTSFLS